MATDVAAIGPEMDELAGPTVSIMGGAIRHSIAEGDELAMPSVSKALNLEASSGSVEELFASIVRLCPDQEETKQASASLYQRLRLLLDELARVEANGGLPQGDVLTQFPELLAKFTKYLQRHADKPFVARLTQQQRRMDELKTFHVELDKVLAAFKLPPHADWKQQWEADRATQLRLLAEVVDNGEQVLDDLQDTRAQVEALTQLKFYLDRLAPDADEFTRLLKKASTTIAEAASTSVATLPPWYLPADEVEFDAEPFAQGSFGSVHHGVWKAGEPVVVKRLLLSKSGMSDIVKDRFIDEVSIWHRLDHPNVVRLFGASHVSSPPFFVCQKAAKENMAAFLAEAPTSRRHMWQLLFGAAQGLAYIHKNYVVHGDLKLNNILVDTVEGSDALVARVADFGLSFVRPSSQAVQPLDADTSARPRGGGLRWRAPETLKKRPTFASDVYSLAMCIIEAATGEVPYAKLDDESVHKELKNGNTPDRPPQLSDDAWVLVQAMSQFEPSGRLSLAEVLVVLEDFANVEKANNLLPPCTQCCVSPAQTGQPLCLECQVSADGSETRNVEPAPSSPRGRRNTGSTPGAGIVPLVQLLRAGSADQMHYAAHALGDLAADTEDNRRDMIKAGAVPLLADMVLTGSPVLKDEATRVLQFLASEGETCVVIAEAGCLGLLLDLLHTGTAQQKQSVAYALSKFLGGEGKASVVVNASAIRSLVELLTSGTEVQKVHAAKALSNLAFTHATDPTISSPTVVLPLLKLVQSGNDDQSLFALKALGALSTQPHVCSIIAGAGGVAGFVAQLYTVGEDHQQFALMALYNLAKNNASNCSTIAEVGGVQSLVALLRGEPGELKRLASRVVKRLADVNASLSKTLLDAGVVAPLVEYLRCGDDKEKRCVAKTIEHLATKYPSSGKAVTAAGAVPPLVEMFQHNDERQRVVAELSMKALVQDELSCLAIAESGGYSIVFEMLQTGTASQKRAAVFTIAVSFAKDSDPASSGIVRRLEPLVGFLRASSSDTQKELAMQVFADLARISMNRSSLVAAGIVPPLVKLVTSGSFPQKNLATSVLGQLAVEEAAVEAIVASGGVQALASFLLAGDVTQEGNAAWTLGQLATDSAHCSAVAQMGVVPTLVALVRTGSPAQIERAAFLLAKLTQEPSTHQSIAVNGALELLVPLAQSGATSAQKEYAVSALGALLETVDEAPLASQPEFLATLMGLMDAGNDGAKLGATACLAALAKRFPSPVETYLSSPPGAHVVPLLLTLLRAGVGGQREQAAVALGHCAALSDKVREAIAKTGGIEVMAKQLQSRTDSATSTTLPVLKALAPLPTHAPAFQAAKVASVMVSVATGGSSKQKLQILDALLAFPALAPTEAGDVVALGQQLLKSDVEAEKDGAAALLAHLSTSVPKVLAQKGAVTDLVAVLQNGSSKQKLLVVTALFNVSEDASTKDQLKAAGLVDVVVKLLDEMYDNDPVMEPLEKLAVSLGRSKLMAKEVVDKWLMPRLEEAVNRGAGGRPEFAREVIASFKAKRSSFSLGGRTRSMSSEHNNA